jgi:mRNA-degrading endonuclease RelE of RelBE toxin-antitoxin system
LGERLDIYTAMPYNLGMIFIETTVFTKLIGSYLTDDEYLGLQGFLLRNPEAGKIVRGSGGVRKLRWAMPGKGKSGGIRVIYYWKRQADEIWLLTVYGKSEQETIPGHILRKIAEETRND